MLVIEIAGDALVKNGEFVILGRVPLAIAQANGAENMLDAERKLFSRINAGVQQGTLNPLHPENLTPLPKGDYGIGIVPFDELVEWGNATKLFEFRRPINPAVTIKPLAGSGATRAPAPITPVSGSGTTFRARRMTAKKPNWKEWAHIPEVRVWQACALSLNIDPHSLKHDTNGWMAGPGGGPFFEDDTFPSSSVEEEYKLRTRVLLANLSNRTFFSPGILSLESPAKCGVRLSDFAAWAVSEMKWDDLPPELVGLAQKSHTQADALAATVDTVAITSPSGEGWTAARASDKSTADLKLIADLDDLDERDKQRAEIRRKEGRYNLEEAAKIIAQMAGAGYEAILVTLVESVENYTLATYMPGSTAPTKFGSGRGKWSGADVYFEECYWDELNEWLKTKMPRLDYEFPNPADTSAAKVEAVVRGITKQQVITAFEGLHFNADQWGKYLASPPEWLIDCRVAKGSKKTSATWNPVLIAIALADPKRGISVKKLDALFVGLKDWTDEWREKSDYLR